MMKKLSGLLLAFLALLLPGLAAATPPTVEDRLKALEDQVRTLATENTQLKKQLGWMRGRAVISGRRIGTSGEG